MAKNNAARLSRRSPPRQAGLEQINFEKRIPEVYGTLVSVLDSANNLRLRLHSGRLFTQPPGHFKIEMPYPPAFPCGAAFGSAVGPAAFRPRSGGVAAAPPALRLRS